MTFEEWAASKIPPSSTQYKFDQYIAKSAWNQAITEAIELVLKKLNAGGSQLLPEEMAELYLDSRDRR